MRTKLRAFGVAVMAFFMALTSVFAIVGAGVLSDASGVAQADEISAVDALRAEAEPNGWSVATFSEGVLTDAAANEIDNPFWYEDECLKILTIGNSFSVDTMEYVGQIAESYGKSVFLGNAAIGGCDITTHYNNYINDAAAYQYFVYDDGEWTNTLGNKLAAVVKSTDWDFISIQQASGKAGLWSTYSDLENLLTAVKKDAPTTAKLVWNMVWADKQNSQREDFALYSNDQLTMYGEIVKIVRDNVEKLSLIDIVSPTGTAIQNARTSFVGDTLTRDNYHLNYTYGRYIAGLTFFCALTGLNVNDVEFKVPDVSAQGDLSAMCIQAASAAINNPYTVTNLNGLPRFVNEITEASEAQYTYFTTYQHSGYGYTANSAMAFVPNKNTYSAKPDVNAPDENMLNNEKYSVVLRNDESTKLGLVYTADRNGRVYFKDLAQVAPLHYDQRESAGVYGEYRIIKISTEGTTTQLYPEKGVHELYAANAAPTTSAYVNSSVEMKVGDKLAFISEKASSEIYSSPVVSYTEFEEVYELKDFWKWQQINDANYFEAVYRNANGKWTTFENLETKHENSDIYQRVVNPYASALYWTTAYQYAFAFGGIWVHAGEVPSADGIGDVGYAFKVPHSGYVNIKFDMLGHYQPGLAVYHNDTRLYYTEAADGVNVFHYGLTYTKDALYVEQGDVLYFVETSERGPATVDINPVITYIDYPYTIDKTQIEIENGAEDTLTLALNDTDFDVSADNVEWSVEKEGIVELTANGATATVKGISVGQTVVSAKIGEYDKVSCAVTVKASSRFEVQSQTVSVTEGENAEIEVLITDADFTADMLAIDVEDEAIATATIDGTRITVFGEAVGICKLYIHGENSLSITVEISVEEKTYDYSAVDFLRAGRESNGWSVATFDGTTLSEISAYSTVDYTYYTTWVQSGIGYIEDGAMAFVPDKLVHTVPADCYGPDKNMVNSQKYGVVLKNDETNKMALVYTASVAGTLYYQDLAQVAPLHYDEKDNAGVYGEYRIVKVSAAGTSTQLYPEQGNHELFASNGAPTTSAYVNSSVEMKVGDKLVFVSEKASSEIYSSPVVSYTEFEEVYELKNFWKWQQINDANYFEAVYRNANGEWTTFENLETKCANYDIYNRSGKEYSSALYWTTSYAYAFAFGGIWVHAGEVPSADGKGDVGYAFKVPHSGYVNIKFDMLGHYQPGLAVYHNGTRLYYTEAADGATVFHYGMTYTRNALYVEQGDVLYFVETSERGPATVDINPVITYIDEPYTIDKTQIEIDNGAEDTLALTLNGDFAVSADDVVWSVANEGIVELTPNGATVTVKGVSVGQTVIYAKIGDYARVSCSVTVNAVSRFTVQTKEISVEEGQTASVIVTVTDSTFTADKLRVTVEDGTIATATASGTTITVTGVSAGICELYIQGENATSVTVVITVTEKPQSGDNTSGGESPDKPKEKGGCGLTVSYTEIALLGVALLFVSTIILKKKKALKD